MSQVPDEYDADSDADDVVTLAAITGLVPNMGVSPWQVDNIAGQTFGNITASGNFTAQANSHVSVIAIPGGNIPPADIPPLPMPGSKPTVTDGSGVWRCEGVPAALCKLAPSASFPTSQVIAWGLNRNGTDSIASAQFTGQSEH